MEKPTPRLLKEPKKEPKNDEPKKKSNEASKPFKEPLKIPKKFFSRPRQKPKEESFWQVEEPYVQARFQSQEKPIEEQSRQKSHSRLSSS